MGIKRSVRAAAVAGVVAIAGTTLAVQPASAAPFTLNFKQSQAQLDNNPANGAKGWVWIWTNNKKGAELDWEFYDGTAGSMTIGAGSSNSASLDKPVWVIQICEFHWDEECSGYKS